MKDYGDNLTYLLDTLASCEASDIEDDEFEVAVNDDQFGTCSIIELAEAASARIKALESAIELGHKYANDALKVNDHPAMHYGGNTPDWFVGLALFICKAEDLQ